MSESAAEALRERRRHRAGKFEFVQLPTDLPQIPGMVSASDCRYLYWLTGRAYSGQGAVVEVGTFMGRSSIHLAAGLRDAGFPDKLFCYDRFRWKKRNGWDELTGLVLPDGADFKPHFERNVRPVYPTLVARKAELSELSWEGGPIEILFLDAPKRLPQIIHALRIFGPALVPELSLMVLQDYFHAPSFELAAAVSLLEGRLRFQHAVDGSSLAAFEVTAPLDLSPAEFARLDFTKWTADEAKARWAKILEPLPDDGRERLGPALALLLHDLGAVDEARACIADFPFNEKGRQRWQRWAGTTLGERYRPVFDAFQKRWA